MVESGRIEYREQSTTAIQDEIHLTSRDARLVRPYFDLRQKYKRTENHDGFPLDRYGHTVRAFLFFFQTEEKKGTSYSPTQRYFPYPHL